MKKEHVLARSYPGMGPLYEDFAQFQAHDGSIGRTDSFQKYGLPKEYRIKGEWVKYGRVENAEKRYRYVFHARGYGRSKTTDIELWKRIVAGVPDAACVGLLGDFHIPGAADLRAIGLRALMDVMAGAEKMIGQSSGPMHLAALCGTDLVVWADDRTYFGETLEKRYKDTWNPFDVHVDYIFTGLDWQPDPKKVRAFL